MINRAAAVCGDKLILAFIVEFVAHMKIIFQWLYNSFETLNAVSGKFLHILFDCRRKMRMVFDCHISFNGFLRIKADLCLVEK